MEYPKHLNTANYNGSELLDPEWPKKASTLLITLELEAASP